MTIGQVAALREQLWDSGFRPVGIYNPDAAVESPGKRPFGDKWRIGALHDPPDAVVDPPRPEALNTGILCDGLRAIDIDIDNPTLAAACRRVAAEMFGEAPTRTRRGSPRCLLLYRAQTGAPPKRVVAGVSGKVEVLGAGQQFVAFGGHHEGAELEWFPEPPGQETVDGLPVVSEDAITAYLAACAPIIGAKPPKALNGHDKASAPPQADPLRIAAALLAIPNTGAPDWEAWNRVGMATWRATGGSRAGFEAFNAWSAHNGAYDPEATGARWDHYRDSPPTEIGAGSLFYMAKEARGEEAPAEAPPNIDDPHYWRSVEADAQEATREPDVETARPQAPFPASAITAEELDHIPPRELVYGHFLFKKFISAIGAPGGAGKTAYAFAVALAVATGRALLGEPVHEPGAVWIYNLEDPRVELLRRLKAALIGHDLAWRDVDGRLFLDSGRDRPLVVATASRDGDLIAWPQVPALIAEIKARAIKLLIIDPFVRSHRVEENHNDQIDFVAALWASIADAADCSILLVHHFKKGGISGEATAFRGATALIDAARSAVTIATMTAAEAEEAKVDENDRWQFVRLDNAKLNLAPPPGVAVWLRLTGIDLDNAAGGRSADSVQTVRRWQFKKVSVFERHSPQDWNTVLDLITAGPSPGVQFSATRQGGSGRWVGEVLMQQHDLDEPKAAEVVKKWFQTGLLMKTMYKHPSWRRMVPGIGVDSSKRPT